MSSRGVMSSKDSSNNPGLCPVKGQMSGLCSWTRARKQLSNLSLGTVKTMMYLVQKVLQVKEEAKMLRISSIRETSGPSRHDICVCGWSVWL